MRLSRRGWRWIGAGALVVVVLMVLAKVWIVPAIIVGQIRARYGGHVAVGDWWIGGSSAGVTGLVLHEGTGADSPAWARAESVSTDLTLWGLLVGRLAPRRVTIQGPSVTIRIDRDGESLTRIPLVEAKGEAGSTDMPEVVARDAQLRFQQVGRDDMVVRDLDARLSRGESGLLLSAVADDPTWGRLKGKGEINGDLAGGQVKLWSESLVADPEKARRIPFVPEATWDHILPSGPVGVVLTLRLPEGPTRPLDLRTDVTFEGTRLDLPTLGIAADATNGRMTVSGGVVRIEGAKGQSVGGTVAADGTLDFHRQPPRIELALGLDGIAIAEAPESWQLQEAALTGELTGKATLRVNLAESGPDLTGTTGEAVVTGGTIGGIPFKSLKLMMSGSGDDLRYDTGQDATGWLDRWFASQVIALQAPGQDEPGKTGETTPQKSGGLILPKTLTTEVEFEDVDLTQVLSKADALGLHLPFVVAGKLSLRAKATIPLGQIRDVRAYVFHGEATLKGADLAGIDIGRASAKLDLEDGVLELTEFQGQLVNKPSGGLLDRPEPTDPLPAEGPLPPGGFRGRLRVEISPLGDLTGHFEAASLPLGELAAPTLPKPTPLSGLVDVEADLSGDLAHATDPSAWTFDGRLASRGITYDGATLDEVEAQVGVRSGRLEVREVSATLDGRPLRARGGLGLTEPYPFEASLSVEGWDLSKLLALVPSVPRPSPVQGMLMVEAKADGALQPLRINSQGRGKIGGFMAGPVALGDVPVRWATGESAIEVTVDEAHPFDGTVSAIARVPTGGEGPVTGSASVRKIDLAQLAAAIPGEAIQLSGQANGTLSFTLRPLAPADVVPIEANLQLDAPDLAVQGIPASGVQAAISVQRGVLHYDLYAESLGGKIKLKGDFPIGFRPVAEDAEGSARLQAIGFTIREEVWQALGVSGALARLQGQGALDANLRFDPDLSNLRARGVAEFRELGWGSDYPLGRLRGVFALAPWGWEIEPLTGELFGGVAIGSVRAEESEEDDGESLQFNLDIDRASLDRLAAIVPAVASAVEGTGSIRLSGRLGEALQATGDLRIPTGTLAGLPLADLRAPVEVTFIPNSGIGTLEARRWTTRMAGGRVEGSAHIRFGLNRAFRSELRLTDLELETVSRVYTDARHPASGKVSGRISLDGLDTFRPETYRGRADLVLADAAVLDLPVFRALDRFLGGPAGGIFERGAIRAAIGNREILVEELNLLGRVAQLHGEGTVGFDGELDLIVLINTNQIIPQTGQALVALIPGLRGASAGAATMQVSNFLSNRLIKLRVQGNLRSPAVSVDPTVTVTNAAVSFFAGALKLPLGLLR